jgi:pSer/pThr/pTyr-binding forkhead associated (FHA) protein
MECGIIERGLYDNTIILFGRFKDSIDENDIQFENKTISRDHARIWMMSKEVY